MNKPKRVIQIKNMVCPRCIMVVHDTLSDLGFEVLEVKLGEATVVIGTGCAEDLLDATLKDLGFDLLQDRRLVLVEKIKLLLIDIVYSRADSHFNTTLSAYLSEHVGKDYSTISSLFRETTGITISRFLALQRIERAKELLEYDEMSISEVAMELGYRNVQHLSRQFKEMTGYTPSFYKQLHPLDRKPISDLV